MPKILTPLTFILKLFPPKMAVIWFWSTMSITFYCGVFHVLPYIYKEDFYWLMIVTRLISFFLIGQMIANWLCIRLISSRYAPSREQRYYEYLYLNDIDGFEIDLEQLKLSKKRPSNNRETFSLPLASIRPIGDNPKLQWNHNTMYLVALNENEACFITSNNTINENQVRNKHCYGNGKRNGQNRIGYDSEKPDILKTGNSDNFEEDRCLEVSLSENRSSKHIAKKFSDFCQRDKDSDLNLNERNGRNEYSPPSGMYKTVGKCEKSSIKSDGDNCHSGEHRCKNGIGKSYINEEKNNLKSNKNHIKKSSNVITTTNPYRNDQKVIVYPYWSWKPCRYCGFIKPPRAHHCKLCGCCVLKRDHHCFFAANCIGLNNQRHFIVFLFWSCVAISFCLIHSFLYVASKCVYNDNNNNENCAIQNRDGTLSEEGKNIRNTDDKNAAEGMWECLSDIILPVTFVKFIFGNRSFLDFLLVIVLYSLIWFAYVCAGFLTDQVQLVLSSRTSFERENRIKIVSYDVDDDNRDGEINCGISNSESSYDSIKRDNILDCNDNSQSKQKPQIKNSEINRRHHSETVFGINGNKKINKSKSLTEKAVKFAHHWNRCFYWVFGHRWVVNFLIPLHFKYKPPEDGISWKSIDLCVGPASKV